MEDDDDMVPEPDSKGQLVLSNRAWVNLDKSIWAMATRIVKLDISYNHIVEIPPQIGEMILLRELIASFNKITAIPKEIGSLRRLRRLVMNTNRIRLIPAELGNCEMLEEIILSENMIEEIPKAMAKIQNLRVLKLTNNKLRSIPFEMADILTLEEFECGNNPHLETVPAKWRDDTESVLFTCRVHRDYHIQMNEMITANQDLSKHAIFVEQDNLLLKEKILSLQAKIEELRRIMPPKIMKKMEEAERLAKEQEMKIEDEDEAKKAQCIIS